MTGQPLAGLVDLHVHSAPDVRPRYADDITVAIEAADAGMAAILLKNHVFSTADRAQLVDDCVEGVRVFGGVVLNTPVGGLNPRAVEVALQVGGRCVWMPTEDAEHHRRLTGERGGLRVVDSAGRLLDPVLEVLDLLADADALLATGHLSPEETAALVAAAFDRGVRRVLVNHPDAANVRMPASLQRELVEAGALLERCYVDTTNKPGQVPLETFAERIRAVGVDGNVLTTDLGQPHNPRPVDGLAAFVEQLALLGFSDAELKTMTADNPTRLVVPEEQLR